MVRIRRALIILEMAADACRGGQVVIVVNVAIGALARRYRVQAGQREARVVMVEGCVHPVRGVVALLAGLREVRRHVVGIGRALEVLQVAGHARRAGQVVVIVDVTICALSRRHRMHSV